MGSMESEYIRRETSSKVAFALSVSPGSVARFAREGRIPFTTTPGGHRRFSIDEVREAIFAEAKVSLTPLAGSDAMVVTMRGTVLPRSNADARRQARRSVYSGAVESESIGTGIKLSVIDEIFSSAQRVLVASQVR